ncbi:hypothetical protein N8787_03760 [Opitutaceae bacterium]|nr:hypothetical protein [Opitutaceae bacterium]
MGFVKRRSITKKPCIGNNEDTDDDGDGYADAFEILVQSNPLDSADRDATDDLLGGYDLPYVNDQKAASRTVGQQDVTNAPSDYSLFTSIDVVSAEVAARSVGQQDVVGSPASYGLFTESDVSSAEAASRTAGQNDVTGDPSSFDLFTQSEVDSAESAARTAGRNDVTSDPGNYSLYTSTQISSAEESARAAGREDVTKDPSSYNLYTEDFFKTEEAMVQAVEIGRSEVLSSPASFDLVTQSEHAEATAAAKTIVNVSTRVALDDGELVTPGFVVLGEQKKMLIRAVGPKLQDLGVLAPMPNPKMTIYKTRWDGNPPDVVASIDDWKEDNDNVAEIVSAMNSAGAFPLEPAETFQGRPFMTDDTSSAAALVTLDVGVYTVQVSSADEGVGEVLVEVYEIVE